MRHEPLSERARNRWQGILPAVGVPSSSLTGKHTACPMCGGKDRFRFDNREGRGTWICSRCGSGDGVSLVMQMQGCDFKSAAALIEPHVGGALVSKPSPEMSDDQKKQAMRSLWKASHRISQNDPAYRYLSARVGDLDAPVSLRAIDRMRYAGGQTAQIFPGMIALIQSADGTPINLHRTFLTNDGRKAPVDSPRRVMAGSLDAGCAVRLADHGETLGIAEGVETALSASKLFNVPVWAALNAGLLAKWEPPAGVKSVLIFGDNDASFTGQKAAYELAFRLSDKFQTTVHLPRQTGTDWNDVLVDQSRRAA